MLKVLTWDRSHITIQEKLPMPEGEVPLHWYHPVYGKVTNVRWVKIPFNRGVMDRLTELKDVRIYNVLSHEPILSLKQQMQIEQGELDGALIACQQRIHLLGEDYIDDFGYNVYIRSYLGRSADKDLRYDQEPETELLTLEYFEDDLLHRTV